MAGKILKLGKRNQITLPRELIPQGTILFQSEVRRDGKIILVPHISIPISKIMKLSQKRGRFDSRRR